MSLLGLGLLALTTTACGADRLGAATKRGLHRQLAKQLDDYKTCYDEALQRDRKLAGKVVLSLAVTERGTLKSVSVSNNGTGDKALGECMVDSTRRARFSPLPGRVYLTYPVAFARATVKDAAAD